MSDELEKVFPLVEEVTVGEEKFVVKPFKFGQLPKVLQVFKDIKVTDGAQAGDFIMEMFTQNPQGLCDIIGMSVGKDGAWAAELETDTALEIGIAVFKVNLDFFVRRVMPLMKKVNLTLPVSR